MLRRFQPTGRREQISDHVERGLRARISPTGEVSFILHVRNAEGKLVLVTLGRYPDLSLKEARDVAARQRQALKQGADLNAEKRARKAKAAAPAEDTAPALRALLWEYQALFAPRRAIWRPAGPRSERSPALRSIEAVFGPLLDRPVDGITSAELAQAMAGYERRGRGESDKTTANGTVSRARAYLAPVLDWVAGRGRFSRHGAGRVPPLEVVDVRTTFDPAREDPTIRGERDRVLTEEELGRLLPLLVYPAPKATLLERASGAAGWHRRDLRRTAATIMQALEVPVSTIDRILGHVNPMRRENVSGAAATYMRLSGVLKGRTDPQAAALNMLAEALQGIERQQDPNHRKGE